MSLVGILTTRLKHKDVHGSTKMQQFVGEGVELVTTPKTRSEMGIPLKVCLEPDSYICVHVYLQWYQSLQVVDSPV